MLAKPLIITLTVASICGLALANIAFAEPQGTFRFIQANLTQVDLSEDNDDTLKAQILANGLQKRLEDIAAALQITGNLPSVRTTPSAALLNSTLETLHGIPEDSDMPKRSVAQDIVSNFQDLQVVFFLMPNGDIYLDQPYSRQQNLTDNNFGFRDYFKGATDTHSTFLGNAIISASTQKKIIVIAVPLYHPKNQSLIGVWAAGIGLEAFNEELQSLDLGDKNQRVIILDSNGTKIADSNKQLLYSNAESFNQFESFQNAIGGKSGSMIEQVNQTQIRVSYVPIKSLQNTLTILWMRTITNN